MRADRLIQIMILLQNHGKMTTKELSSTLEVSDRTILRDMDALSLSGIPVIAERGKMGGWRMMDHFRSQLSGLKLEELKSFFILPSEQILEDIGIQTSGLNTRQKLLASLPKTSQYDAEQYLSKIYVDTGAWRSAQYSNKVFSTVQLALWQDKKLKMSYQKANGEVSERIVSPLGLVCKGSTWYLVAMNAEDFRSFRISRITKAVMLLESFHRPADFNLSQFWKQSKLEFAKSLPIIEGKLLMHKDVIRRITFTNKYVTVIDTQSTDDHQMQLVTIHFNSEQEIVEFVLGFGNKIKLLQPEHLIKIILQQAKQVIGVYEQI